MRELILTSLHKNFEAFSLFRFFKIEKKLMFFLYFHIISFDFDKAFVQSRPKNCLFASFILLFVNLKPALQFSNL